MKKKKENVSSFNFFAYNNIEWNIKHIDIQMKHKMNK